MEPPVDTFYIPYSNRVGRSTISLKPLTDLIAGLKDENAKLRALVERGANLLTDVCKSQDKFIWDCKEALK
jgi:hypothetical protein